MKELSIEEKAKAYDEAIERARAINNGEDVDVEAGITTCEYIFPELKESEDERIRKELLNYLYDVHDDDDEKARWIAWLEKQGDIQKKIDYAYQKGYDDGLRVNLEMQGNPKPADNKLPEFKDKLCELFQRFRWYKDETPTNGDILEYVEAHIQELLGVVNEQNPAEISNICEFSIETWINIVDYVLTEHNGIGNYLIDPEVKDTAEKLQKKYKFDVANEEWDRVYRRGLDAGINYGKTEALRVHVPVEWSDEDKKFINRSIMYLRQYNSSESEVEKRGAQSCINWLEALGDNKLNDPSIVKYKAGDKVRFFSDSEVFTISKVENWRYIFADGGGDTSVYEELIPVKESKDTLTRDKVKCGDYVVNKDGAVIKVHDIDNFGHVCYYYFANEMTEDGGKIQDNRAFMKYYGVIQDCHMATQSEIDFLEKWVAHKKYIWVENNVSPDDEED